MYDQIVYIVKKRYSFLEGGFKGGALCCQGDPPPTQMLSYAPAGRRVDF